VRSKEKLKRKINNGQTTDKRAKNPFGISSIFGSKNCRGNGTNIRKDDHAFKLSLAT
jgi:hypothetical protein